MFKKAGLLSLISVACALPGTAMANNFNYDYFEFRTAISPESYGLELNSSFSDNAHFIVRADTRFKDDWDVAGGFGFNGPVNQFMDIYGQIMLHYMRESPEEGGESDAEYELNLGTRVWLTNQVEGHVKIGRLGEHSVFVGGFRFHSTEHLSLSAEARSSGSWGPQVAMGVRFKY